ncbi:MAG: glycoside hydrolase family 3 N-terminal domain-containing protein, partial [bacterium]
EKVAQLLLTGISKSTKKQDIIDQQAGGILMFAGSFEGETKSSIRKYLTKLQEGVKIKMLIAVDEEGGTVTRVSRFKAFRSQKFASPRKVYEKGGFPEIIRDTKEKDQFLSDLGINTNFAPVADVAYHKGDFIYSRSFATDAAQTAKFITKVVTQMKKDHVVSSVKHFPGYGDNGDTHTDLIEDHRSLETFQKRDLLPFAAGIQADCPMIMVSHNIVSAFDPDLPASISPKVMSYLREEMHYEGIIITDSVSMKGVALKAGSEAKAGVAAIHAGADMVLADRGFQSLHQALLDEVKAGRLTTERIDASVKRILVMKLAYQIIKV